MKEESRIVIRNTDWLEKQELASLERYLEMNEIGYEKQEIKFIQDGD